MQYFRHSNFYGFANAFLFFTMFLLKWGIKSIRFCSFQLFANGHIHNVVSMLINVKKLNVENNNTIWTLSNVVNINVEINSVDSILFSVVYYNVDKHNVVSMFIWRCLSSRRHINLTTTLKCLLIIYHNILRWTPSSTQWNFNWLCKHTKNIRSSQDFILTNLALS